MNGARTIFRRKGYLLTALTAAVLLAASSGTARAQDPIDLKSIRVDAADAAGVVQEGAATRITVVLTRTVPTGETATVTIGKVYPVQGATAFVNSPNPGAANSETSGGGNKGNAEDGEGTDDGVNDIVLGDTMIQIPAGRDRGSVSVIFQDDLDAVDERFGILATALTFTTDQDLDADPITVRKTPFSGKIVDDEEQLFIMKATDTQANLAGIAEGGSFTVDLRADPSRPAGENLDIFVRADTKGYTLDPLPTTETPLVGGVVNKIAVTPPTNDKNRTDDTVVLSALTGSVAANEMIVSQSFTVLDAHKLPAADAISAEAKDKKEGGTTVTAVEEGGEVYVWVTVENTTKDQVSENEAFTVALSAADPSQTVDYRYSPSTVEVPAGRGSNDKRTVGPFMLEALEDQDVGMETLVLNVDVTGESQYGPGSSSGSLPIDIVDKTPKLVEPKSEADAYPKIEDALKDGSGDEGFNPGESFYVMTSDLFTVADGYTAKYGVSVSGDAVGVSVTSDTVTVDAKMAGAAKVTITAEAEMATSSFLPNQTVADKADITFEVTVVDKMLAVMLEMPANVMDGNIVEGMSYDIKVSANRMVSEDTEVMIMRDRAGSDAGEDDYSVSMATIMAGYDSATAELMVTEDDMPDGGTDDNMGETLVLFGTVNGEQTNALTFTIWDKAVPALPLFGQLLLALFLMLGGARLYRRRQG